jgi:hypothetical protein
MFISLLSSILVSAFLSDSIAIFILASKAIQH